MKLVFMGTPDFARSILHTLYDSEQESVAVWTQPDKPKGRGKTLMPTPVKEVALKHEIPVLQPVKVREPEFVEQLRTMEPDVIVVAAFGQIISRDLLELPKYGCINVHASLLPAYRGAAPIQWAVINGDRESGVTIMRMNEGLDTGDMIDKVVVPLAEDETGGSLFEKLSHAGARLCVKVLEDLESGRAVCTPQPEESTTAYAAMITKKMGEICWQRPAEEIEQLIRGLNPWPSAYTYLDNKSLKLWKATVEKAEEETENAVPGQVIRADKNGLCICTGDGILNVLELQLEGKKRMETAAFLRGYSIEVGSVLGKA